MWICIAPRREHTSKAVRYDTRPFSRISLIYSWYSFTDPEGMEG